MHYAHSNHGAQDRSAFIYSSFCSANFYGWTIEGCKECPEHTISPGNGKTVAACTCEPGFYGPNGGPCTGCAVNYYCPGGPVQFRCPVGTSSQKFTTSVLYCTERSWETAKIGQSTVQPGAQNTISVTLRTATELEVSENMVVTISGLRCDSGQCRICNNATLSLNYLSPTTGSNLYHSAEYLVNGDLLLTLTSDLPANATVIFMFCLENPLFGQSSPRMYIESSGIAIPRAEMQRGLRGAAPLSVAGFSTARIGQSTPAHLTSNTITITLNALASLPKGATLVFSGLRGLKTSSSMVLIGNAAPAFPADTSEFAGLLVETNLLSFFAAHAIWNLSAAELSLTLTN